MEREELTLEEAQTIIGQRRLRWLLGWIESQINRPLPPLQKDGDLEVFVVASAWLTLAMNYARGIYELIEAEQSVAGHPVYRALIELWAEVDYLLTHGDPAENAVRVQITSILELHDFFSRPERRDVQSLEPIARQLATLEQEHPRLIADVRASRKKGRHHWSGLSRSGLMRAVGDENFRELYSMLSWDAHPTVHVLRDIEVDAEKRIIQFASASHYGRSPGTLAYHCGGGLFFIYNQYATAFGLPLASTPENIDELLAEMEEG